MSRVPSSRATNPMGALRGRPVLAPVVHRMPTRPARAMSLPPTLLNARLRALGTAGPRDAIGGEGLDMARGSGTLAAMCTHERSYLLICADNGGPVLAVRRRRGPSDVRLMVRVAQLYYGMHLSQAEIGHAARPQPLPGRPPARPRRVRSRSSGSRSSTRRRGSWTSRTRWSRASACRRPSWRTSRPRPPARMPTTWRATPWPRPRWTSSRSSGPTGTDRPSRGAGRCSPSPAGCRWAGREATEIVQLNGAVSRSTQPTRANEIVERFATTSGATFRGLAAPAIVGSRGAPRRPRWTTRRSARRSTPPARPRPPSSAWGSPRRTARTSRRASSTRTSRRACARRARWAT